ncbi:UDP-glucose 4-epimerase GalE [Bradyrhizobium sp. NBAIM20]|uniref:UDP-glucose 4-epimerase GalE n=1 Tax=unclassified Bradyrhizobium TaxID=2631580 RepID=UPI001CD4E74D|nr:MULTISPECIES: UDP-glucose 4-epimerase GalE [unclassified Bradyrhizobium]MCA1414689.1 UDP-glucose 4-epimerase GalE [Bradyrhizobium sp. NBAIM20]MCA1461878.1 UDP-glucose 4-epimerase GalE [Bradyrhizobium sp. NBAIM18]
MAILVTGGAGYIGSQMVLDLVDADETVLVLDDLSTGFEAAVSPKSRLVVGDVGEASLVSRLIVEHNIDAIIHFAGSIVVPESVANPLYYYLNNASKTRTLIEVAVACRVPHFIFSSTAAVYSAQGSLPVKEGDPLLPQSPYGRSKLISEWILQDVSRVQPIKFAILRYFNVAGADPQRGIGQSTRGASHLIKAAIETATGKRPFVEVFGTDYPTPDGTCVRDYVHVKDLAGAHRLALARLRDGGESIIVNCGYGRGYSVLEVLHAVEKISGIKLDIRMAARRPGDAAMIIADPSVATTQLSWTPTFDSLDAIIRSALEWELARSY